MAEYKTNPVALTEGLDLVSPPSIKPAGAMEYCLNYEIVDQIGYQRIAGFERADGWTNGSLDEVHRITLLGEHDVFVPATRISVGQYGYPFGTVLEYTRTSDLGIFGRTHVTYKPLFPENMPSEAYVSEDIHIFNSPTGYAMAEPPITDPAEIFASPAIQYAKMLQWSAELRARVITPIGAPLGIHWLDPFLYAIFDDVEFTALDWDATSLAIGGTYKFDGKRYTVFSVTSIGGGDYRIMMGGGGARPSTTTGNLTSLLDVVLGPVVITYGQSETAHMYKAPSELETVNPRAWYPMLHPDGALPGSALLSENASRYQCITHNFYSSADTKYGYGVSGAGQPFWFDDDTVHMIDPAGTAAFARHIAVHQQHLALGYKEGSVLLSVTGDPENFDGIDGGSEFGFGDAITGLLSIQGTTLAVFCTNKVASIEGSSIQDFYPKTISPNVGALEYTAVDMGQIVFASSNGISVLGQAAEYGDFVRGKLSRQIYPLIKPDLIRPAQYYGMSSRIRPRAGVIAAIPVRNKDQYRLYFNNGICVTGTATDQGFKWTKQELRNADGTPLIPLALASLLDNRGEERLYMSNGNWESTRKYVYNDMLNIWEYVDIPQDTHLYRLDVGWGFDGTPIPHRFELAHMFGQEMSENTNIVKVRAHGLTKGRASILVQVQAVDRDHEEGWQDAAEDISMPASSEYIRKTVFPCTTIASGLANTGLAIKLRFKSPETLALPEPLHNIQVLVMHTEPEGADDA